MKYTENALNILTVTKGYKGVKNAWVVKNLEHMNSVRKIVEELNKTAALKEHPTTIDTFESMKSTFETEFKNLEKSLCCDGITALGDDDFPQHRGTVQAGKNPVLLYYKGDIRLLYRKSKNIAVIGLLNPTETIEKRERKLVSALIEQGVVIVSGLAFGCDSIAHDQALESGGKTVAILPGPLNKILPEKNTELAHRIVEKGGLLVTEYNSDFSSQRELAGRYVERDRLQALFCDAVVLAASYAQESAKQWPVLQGKKIDSGARHAMDFAQEYGIPRAVMYNEKIDAEDPMLDLNREAINKKAIILSQNNLSKLMANMKNPDDPKITRQSSPLHKNSQLSFL